MQPQLPPDFLDDYMAMKRRLELVEKALTNDAVQVGTELFWPAAAGELPFNYHIEDGSALDRIGFASLFQLIGTDYGTGDGITSFNIPNRTGARVYIPSNQDPWHSVGAGGGEPAFANSWVNGGASYQTMQFRIDDLGRVWLRGYITGGPNATVAFTLPAGYRPPTKFITVTLDGSSFAYIEIDTTGTIKPVSTALAAHINTAFDTDVIPAATTAETGTWVIKTL